MGSPEEEIDAVPQSGLSVDPGDNLAMQLAHFSLPVPSSNPCQGVS